MNILQWIELEKYPKFAENYSFGVVMLCMVYTSRA